MQGGSSPISYTFNMGIDQDEIMKVPELFKVDSSICGITGYSLTTDDSGDDFAISPNLLSRFAFNGFLGELKLLNINSATWNGRTATVYIKAVTKGDVAAYKQVDVKFTANSGPTINGNLGPWDITVNEADDNAGQT
jgi:hypothetical protein